MSKIKKIYGLCIVIATATMLTTTSALAFTITTGGTLLTGGSPTVDQGYTTSVVGATVIDFNSSLSLPSGYTGGAVKYGSSGGNWASPPDDDSNFYTVGPGAGQSSPGTLTLGSLNQYFGFYGGSPDTYNSIEFWRDDTQLEVITGTELATAALVNPNGDQTVGVYWNIWADSISERFNKVIFVSTSNAFETDNHAFSAVPIPAAVWLFGCGLIGLIGFSKRKKAA